MGSRIVNKSHNRYMEIDMMNKFALISFAIVITSGCAANKKEQHTHEKPKFNPSSQVLNCIGPSGHHIYAEEMKCPLGGEKFTALQLGTHSTFGVNLDWEPQSYLQFPVAIPICPSNGFIVDKADLKPDEVAQRKVFIESDTYQQLYKQKHASFFLYGKLVEALNAENKNDLWWYYLEATWEANHCGNTQRYNEYANLVINEGLKRKATITTSDEEYWVISLVVSEMYRRIGDFPAAQRELTNMPEPKLPEAAQNNFFNKAKNILQQAIKEKDTKQLPIKMDEQ